MRTVLKMAGAVAAVVVVSAAFNLAPVTLSGQAPTSSAAARGQAPKTPWGDADLQGIWADENDTPLQRSPKFANQEFFTDEQRTQLDKERAALLSRDKRVERGTELDVAGAYNAVFISVKPTSRRTSLIVDPPNGRIPAQTPDAQQRAADDRAFRLALLQSTQTCKSKSVACAGGTYDPNPSPRYGEAPPRYNTGRMNRHDHPEDGSLGDRCMSAILPDFGTGYGGFFRRIVQTPGGLSIADDTAQGQAWQRNIVMNGAPHLPAGVRQWWGDSRGRWEGNTLVIDVTNFSPKTDFAGARENLHLVERWTRTGADSLEYTVVIDDPTVWTRPWTVKQDLTKQSDQANRFYIEPRCFEGNYGFPALLLGARMEELAFSEGRGPHPATKDNATDFVGVEDNPLN